MKTKTQVLRENPELKTIINAVIKNVGMESIQDINNHGIDAEFNGFIYYNDTHKFAIKHRSIIIKMLQNLTDDMSINIMELICGFGIFREAPADEDDKMEIYKFLSGVKMEQSTITNVLAWFAAEEVCRLFEE